MKNSIIETTITISALLVTLMACNGSGKNTLQSGKVFFDSLEEKLMSYKQQGLTAYEAGDQKLAYRYWNDSTVSAVIRSYIGNYRFKNINGEAVDTKELDRPLFLQVTASNCAPCIAEVPALNHVSEKYADKVQIVLLFMDTPGKTEELSGNYNKHIAVVPQFAHENMKGAAFDNFSGFKHLLSATPTNYLIGANKQIMGIRKGAVVPVNYIDENTGERVVISKEDALKRNIEDLEKDIALIMQSKDAR